MSVAATIQGESNGTPESMFAVATTIYNRMIQSGQSPEAVVNAPNAYCCQNGNASPMAQTFANAISDGTLGNFGTIGNATSFRTAGSDTGIGRSGAPNIGGNQFSNNDGGAPSDNFIPPQYNGGSATVDNSNNGDFGGGDVTPGMGIDPGTTVNAGDGTTNSVDTGAPFTQPLDQGGTTIGMPGLGIPGMTMGSGGGLTYATPAQNEQNVQGVTMAKSALLAGVPDVAKAIGGGFNAVTAQIGAQVSKTIADAEAYAGRGFVMLFAIVMAAVAIWLLIPRDTKQRIISTVIAPEASGGSKILAAGSKGAGKPTSRLVSGYVPGLGARS